MDEILKRITNKPEYQIEEEQEKEKDKEKEREDDDLKTLIIIYRNNETLKSFQQQYFSCDSHIENCCASDFLSFGNIKLDDVSLDTYSCLFEEEEEEEGINFIEIVKIFLRSVRKENVHWLILLDWSIYDQQKWLDHILKCVKEIDGWNKEGNGHIGNNKTIICINSEHIYKIQKNLPVWYSHHIDYIQQTLRWYSLQKRCNLIYSETGQTQLKELIKKIVDINNKFDMKDVEMAKTTRILVPYGYDTINLIKTLDETFNEEECTVEKYKKVIPAPSNKDRQMGSLFMDSTESNIEYFTVTGTLDKDETTGQEPDFIDKQRQYRKLFEYSKKLNRQ